MTLTKYPLLRYGLAVVLALSMSFGVFGASIALATQVPDAGGGGVGYFIHKGTKYYPEAVDLRGPKTVSVRVIDVDATRWIAKETDIYPFRLSNGICFSNRWHRFNKLGPISGTHRNVTQVVTYYTHRTACPGSVANATSVLGAVEVVTNANRAWVTASAYLGSGGDLKWFLR